MIRRVAVTTVLFASIAAGLALTGAQERQGRKFALLVGVKDYVAMEKLKYTENDVEDLAKVLEGGGYRQVVVMTRRRAQEDASLEPTFANIRDQLKSMLATLKNGDTVLVGFSGHGVQDTLLDKEGNPVTGDDGKPRKVPYFCPQDARPKSREFLLSLDDIYRQLGRSRADQKFLFVDACRANIDKSGSGDEFEPEAPREGILAFFSCAPGQSSHESEVHKHGFFFHHVIEGLKGGPAGKTRNAKGDVTPALLEEYLTDEVPIDVKREKGNLVLQIPSRRGETIGRVALLTVQPGKTGGDVDALELGQGVKLALVRIKAGEFQMGSPGSDKDAYDDEKPRHKVIITRDFYLGKYSVTREEFGRFVEDDGYQTEAEKDGGGGWGYNEDKNELEGRKPIYNWKNPGFTQDRRHPVVNVTWNDAVAFCRWLSRKTSRKCELPTEAQWEYACRAGTTTRYFTGDDPDSLDGYANVADRTLKKMKIKGLENWPFFSLDDGYAFTSPVGSLKPNPWGLYDMTGNVWQWCSDWYGDKYYQVTPESDPEGPGSGSLRVLRGGSWINDPRFCRAASRTWIVPGYRRSNIGFRVLVRLD